ncbi:SWI/SNF-related matrix-associated actin-dependent regulator of chromatin subfamily A containing DEAD/H box 1 [Oryzias melastigma]|uniref:DNA helicase n=1 Tax=Oryzias melastigma TaxID=30732 RepID=A0A834CI36_ORYME|nr:SWI/SNF-related matrix-associated actin-dependent regulator of chromatin subfamily A containing DEAD/H box 1 [Oryzias melastigma]
MFNLDRFRYEKTGTSKEKQSGSNSPESEKENKPAKPVRPAKTHQKSNPRGVVFEDVISLDSDEEVLSEPNTKTSAAKKVKSSVQKSSKNEDHTSDEDVMDDKMTRLVEMFPQLSRVDLLEVISSTCTLDGAVALCLSRFGDEKGKSHKRKQDSSSLSEDHGKDQPNKRRRSSADSNEAENSQRNEPNWEKQEAMVGKLQKRFPDQDKEELRMVLQEHDWDVEEALQVLEMFSDTETKTVPRFTSESSIAKKQVAERKSKAHSSNEPISSEDELDDEDDVASSEFGDSDEDLDASEGLTETKKEILPCDVFNKENGLSEALLLGCKVVLKERKVVLGLMSKSKLKPYQLIGLKWLLLLHEHELSAILADEMGLGKTIQAIAFLAKLFENGIEGPHLIVVPSSTLDNWVRELKLWCPSLEVLIYYGSVDERRYLKHEILNNYVQFNVIVTTYNLAIGNDSDRGLFRKLPLVYAVFDEGHMLKNMNSLRYRHLMSINKSHEDQSRFERDRISQAKRIMKPFILRRVKSEVLQQLPSKEEKVEFCPMSEKQIPLYQNLFKKLKTAAVGEKRELCNVMMQLRKMANHPLLHRQYYTKEKLQAMSKLMLKEPTHFDADPALIQEDMEVMSDFELHRLCQQFSSISSYQLDIDLVLDSGKFHHLTKLLATLKSKGDKVVLFSQFTMMLDIVEVLLKNLKHRYVRLDGSTPMADRIVLIDEYNTDPDIFVFLLSTRAGGLGINLTSANVVILHDIDCNPYNDKQAEDRCHRVGQTRTVQVIKLISKDTIEDCILQLGQKKLKLEQDMTAAEEGSEGTIPEDMASLLKASLGL